MPPRPLGSCRCDLLRAGRTRFLGARRNACRDHRGAARRKRARASLRTDVLWRKIPRDASLDPARAGKIGHQTPFMAPGPARLADGRVVKNVTGYDLPRGLAGSFGTLAVATEITLKVLPRAEISVTLILENLDPFRAAEALCTAMGAPVDVSGAAHLPPGAAKTQGFATAITALRLEGFAPSVTERYERLALMLKSFTSAGRLDAPASQTLWRAIRDVTPLAEPRDKIIWKILVSPTAGPKVASAIGGPHNAKALFDWSGGLVWLALDPCADAAAGIIRQAIAQHGGGHATLVRAPVESRARIPVFEPQPEALASLSRRLKEAFDPYAILEPRRMWAEF
jgi:glycolate oxidase FAD binding subunit